LSPVTSRTSVEFPESKQQPTELGFFGLDAKVSYVAMCGFRLQVVYQVLQSKLPFLESLADTLIKQFKLAK
jgi:hypothetical protein